MAGIELRASDGIQHQYKNLLQHIKTSLFAMLIRGCPISAKDSIERFIEPRRRWVMMRHSGWNKSVHHEHKVCSFERFLHNTILCNVSKHLIGMIKYIVLTAPAARA